jgi:hypothetical protein
LNGRWIDVKNADGSSVFEEKSTEFTSGERPKSILPEHVKYSYPIANQYNFYSKEYNEGYMLLTENYAYLFSTEKPKGFNQVVRYSDFDGTTSDVGFDYLTFSAGNEIRMEIDFPINQTNFKKNEIYQFAIVNVPQQTGANISSNITAQANAISDSLYINKQKAEGTLEMLDVKDIFTLHFRTSSYSTFTEKMAAIQNNKGVIWPRYPHVYDLLSNINETNALPEVFDLFENNSIVLDDNLVKIIPVYNKTEWYNSKVFPLIYGNAEVLAKVNMSSLKPPVNNGVVLVNLGTSGAQLNESIIESDSRPNIESYGAISYNASYYIDRDFFAIRNSLANKALNLSNTSGGIAKFLSENNIPDLLNGAYELQFNYVLPGKNQVTSSVTRTIQLSGFKD